MVLRGAEMKLIKVKLHNFRCFGEEQVIEINDITSFIGNNSSGKTAVLQALNILFSENSSDRILKRSDFYLPKDCTPEELVSQDLHIETVFAFEKEDYRKETYSIPVFFESMVVEQPGGSPYLRIRLEAKWEKSNNLEGAIESKIYYITCPESEEITEEVKRPVSRKNLDLIKVIYVPASRNPSKQLRNVSGTMINQVMNNINWSPDIKEKIESKIKDLNDCFLKESGVSVVQSSIQSSWKTYDSDIRYSNAHLRFNSTDIDSAIKKSEVVFTPTVTGKEYSVDEMSDGLKSLFYISLVDSILEINLKIQDELNNKKERMSFSTRPPLLTIIALEEPENHIAPQLIGKLIWNLNNVASKSNAQTIITSHSPAVIKRMDPKNLRYFRFNEIECKTTVRSITLPDEEEFSSRYKYIKEAVTAYPELYFAKLVVLGEGDSEELILPRFWKARKNGLDIDGLSIVPLGGRHVNHFWRLLNDLDIPYVTLLDLDKERHEGGWCRVKYVIDQLIKFGLDEKEMLEDMKTSKKDFENMRKWDINDFNKLDKWIQYLENHNVFFSAPLDIDFLMLEEYEDVYKNLLEDNEGPRIKIGDEIKAVKDIEWSQNIKEYEMRVLKDVHYTLKSDTSNGDTYTQKQKKLMVWYTYFFLNRGKPSTHIEALSMMDDKKILSNMPPVFSRMIDKILSVLSESKNDDNGI